MPVVQYVDILMLSESKLDSTFPSIQFLINGFPFPHKLDRNSKVSGILLYVMEKNHCFTTEQILCSTAYSNFVF